MSTNVDNRLLKSNDTSTGMSLKSALGLEQEQEQSRPASMNKAATANYLSSLRREQDEVGDNLSRSMNKLNQSLSQAANKSDTAPVDEQAQKMAVYSKLAGKLIDRDSSLQEKVAQNLSSNSNVVRTKDASESLQKAMDNLPPALKEGTQAGKDLAKFMVENLVTLSDRKQMGAGLERDLAVRQISIPKNQPNSRIQQASSKVLSASIEYVKNNQPEVLAKIPPETKAESQTSSTTTIKAQEHSAPAQTKDTTYISALKAQRHQSAINNDQEPKAQAPQDKISAEISKRIHSLIAQAATTAKSGNLISLSPEEAERFDRTQSPQSSDNLKRIFGQNNNSSSNTSSVNNGADGELPPPSTTNKQAPTNVRQLSLAELSARANQLQTQFREERQRIVQEGKLPDPAQMPEYTFDKASVKATLTQAHIQQQQQEQQRAQQTSSLYESLARARSAISAHSSQYANQTQQAEQPAPQQQQPAQPQTTEQKPVAQDNKATAAQQQPAQPQTTEQKPVAQDNKAPAAQQPAQPQTTEQKPVAQDNKAPATQQPTQSQTTEQKPVVQDNKAPAAQQPAQPQNTEQKPVAQDNKAPAAQQPAQSQTTEQKPVIQDNKAPAAQQPAQPQTTEQKPVVQDNKAPAAQQPAQPQTTEQKPVVQDNKAPATQQPTQSQTTEQKPVAQDNKAPAAQQQPAQSQTTEQKPVAQDNKAPAAQQPAQSQTTEQKPVAQDNKAPATQQPAQSQTTEQKPVAQDNKAPAVQQPAQSQTTEQKPVVQDNKAPAAQQPAQPQNTEQKPVVQDNKAPAAQQQPSHSQTTEQKPSNIELNHSSLNFGKTDVNLSFNAIQSSTYGGMDIMPGMTIPVSHFGQFDNDTIQPNNKALEALKVQARLLESQLKSAEQELAQLKQNATLESKPTLNTSQPVADGDEQQLSSGSNVANKPSIVPNTEVPKGPSGVPLADGDEQQLSSGSNVANKPSIVPNTEVPKVPSGVPLADGDEQQLSSGSNVANKPSIVPNTEVPKGPSGVPVADGDEQQLSSGSNVANKPSIVPNTEVPKGPSGVPVADGDKSVVEQKVDTVVKPPVMTTEQPVNSNNNLAGAGAPTVEHHNRSNPFAKLYGAMQQGHYDEANIQQPNLNDKGNSSNTLGFNTALAKPMDGNSQSSQTQSNSNHYVPSGSGSMMSEASDEAQFSNNTIIVKGPVDAEAASEEPSITNKPNHVTNASATDVSKTKEFLAQNAQEKEAVVQEKQATKEALEQNIKENKQEQKIQEEQVVQEEFVATMQARAQSTQQAIEQAQIQANLQAQQVQSNQQLANGKLYENGQINQFSRLYQQTISEQNAQQSRVLGSSQVNTVGDTNIKATGATIATTTTNINVETQEQGQQNTGANNLANRNTVGHTTVDQSNRLLGGDQSAVSANQLNQGTQAQGQAQAQAQNLANNPSAGAQNTATQGGQAQAQGQAQVSTPAQVQGQPQAQAQAQAQVQGQAQAPVQVQPQGQAQAQTNVPNSNVQSQAVQPNVNVGAVSGTGAVSQMQAQVQAQAQAQVQAQAQAQAQIQAQIQANGNAIQMPNGLSTPVVNLDEDSLQDEIIKNVMQTVPSDDLDEFGIKNNNNLTSAPLSGVVADTDLTEDNNTFSQILNKGASEPNALSALGDSSKVVPTNSALGAAQITSGQNDPIPEESVVNNVATPKEGGILRRLASLFGRKNNVEEAVSSSSNESKSVDPSKAALDNLLNKSEQTASSQNSAATNIRMNSYESLVNKLQMAAADEALPPKMQEQAQNLLKSLQNPVNDLKTVSSWLNFVTGPMSPSSSQALALHQWAFMLLCIRFEQIGKNVEKFLKKTQGGTDKIAKLDTAIKDSAKVAQELDDVTVSKSHDLLKETFSQVERMQQQMQSIPQDQSVLRYIPLPPNYQGGKEGSFSAQKRKDEDGGTSWHLNFNLDLQDMGALQVKVKLRFPEIQMSFVAEKFETLQKVQQHMPELNAKLKEIGLTSTGSNARLGHINFNQDQAPSPSNNGSRFKYEGNAFNVDA